MSEVKPGEINRGQTRLNDRVVMVVGAGAAGPGWGNGKATAVAFAREGAKVIAIDINEEAAQETVSLIREEGNTAEAVVADVANHAEVEAVVNQCVERHGRIDVLHYNVGIGKVGGLELSEEEWRQTFDINVHGCFFFCKHTLPIMEKQGSGVVLTISSIAGIRWSGADLLAYSTTKSGLIQFTRSIAMRYAKKGIRAVCILPGMMNTPIMYNAYRSNLQESYGVNDLEELVKKRDSQCPTGKMGDAWDIANAAVFLASDDAKYITATELIVDGGVTAKFA